MARGEENHLRNFVPLGICRITVRGCRAYGKVGTSGLVVFVAGHVDGIVK